jgi:hypothetical protein
MAGRKKAFLEEQIEVGRAIREAGESIPFVRDPDIEALQAEVMRIGSFA